METLIIYFNWRNFREAKNSRNSLDKLSRIKECKKFRDINFREPGNLPWMISSKKGKIKVFYLSKIRKRNMKRISRDKLLRMNDFKFFARQTFAKKRPKFVKFTKVSLAKFLRLKYTNENKN